MKTTFKYLVAVTIFVASSFVAQAQVKIGSNPTIADPTLNLEVEGSVGGTISKVAVTKDSSKVGIGTATPTTKLELNSGKTDLSGLKFTQLKSTSVDQTGTIANLSVDQNGNVGKTSTPAYKIIAVQATTGFALNSFASPTALIPLINTDNTYTISGGDVIVGVAGIYKITVLIGFNTIANPITYAVDLLKNGTAVERIATDNSPAIVTSCVVGGTTVLTFAAGDAITWRAGVSAPFSTFENSGKMIIERLQ